MDKPLQIGQAVTWTSGRKIMTGVIISWAVQSATNNIAMGQGKDQDRILIIKLKSGRSVMKLESDVEPQL